MEEIRIDGKGLALLEQHLAHSMQELKKLIGQLQASDPLLRSALGENDCPTFRKHIASMAQGYADAEKDIVSMLQYLEEYSNRVGEIRLLLNPDGSCANPPE